MTLQTPKKGALTEDARFFAVIDLTAVRGLTKSVEKDAKAELVDIDLESAESNEKDDEHSRNC